MTSGGRHSTRRRLLADYLERRRDPCRRPAEEPYCTARPHLRGVVAAAGLGLTATSAVIARQRATQPREGICAGRLGTLLASTALSCAVAVSTAVQLARPQSRPYGNLGLCALSAAEDGFQLVGVLSTAEHSATWLLAARAASRRLLPPSRSWFVTPTYRIAHNVRGRIARRDQMLKVLSWNMGHRDESWRALVGSGCDLALLQEAGRPPPEIAAHLRLEGQSWHTEGAWKRPWRSAVVALSDRVRVEQLVPCLLESARPGEFAVSQRGAVEAAKVTQVDNGAWFLAVSMYGLWDKPHEHTQSGWIYADASVHRAISDLSGLVGQQRRHRIVAAGDLNILHGQGDHRSTYWQARYATVFDRMRAIGVPFVGPQHPNGIQASPRPDELPHDSQNVPTYRTRPADPASATRQLDFVFASADLGSRITTRALNRPEEWGPSDHCRVEIDLDTNGLD